MKIRVLLFATLKQRAGWSQQVFEVPAGTTVEHLLQTLNTEHPQLRILQISVYVAVNEEYADIHRELQEGDEIALFPPVSGGTCHE